MEDKTHLKEAFLVEVARHGNVSRAATTIGIHRRTSGEWAKKDKAFRKAFDEAKKEGRSA